MTEHLKVFRDGDVVTKPVDLEETHVELYRFPSVDRVFSLYH
jgi:hypothetical protein